MTKNYGHLISINEKQVLKKGREVAQIILFQSFQEQHFRNSEFSLFGKLISTLWNFYPFSLKIFKEKKTSLLKV